MTSKSHVSGTVALVLAVALATPTMIRAADQAQRQAQEPVQTTPAQPAPQQSPQQQQQAQQSQQSQQSVPQQQIEQLQQQQAQQLQQYRQAQQQAQPDIAEPGDARGQAVADARREGIIWSTFATNPSLRHAGIEIEVRQGTAFISGSVESQVERELAQELARNVEGISRVENRLQIDPDRRPVSRATIGGTRTLRDSDRDRIEDGRGDRDFGTVVSDATTSAQIKSKLLWNRNTSGLDINVDTWHGQVTLTGAVDSDAERTLAEQLARNTGNVTAVDNQLQVGAATAEATGIARTTADARGVRGFDVQQGAVSGQPTQRTEATTPDDAWITREVSSALLYSQDVDGMSIDVETINGEVRLSGEVGSEMAREEAISLARRVPGVHTIDVTGLNVEPDRAIADIPDDFD